ISIGIHDNICAKFQASIDASLERLSQTTVFRKANNVMYTAFTCNLNRSVSAPVINNKNFNFINSWHLTRDILQCDRQCFFFIETRNLYNQFHDSASDNCCLLFLETNIDKMYSTPAIIKSPIVI